MRSLKEYQPTTTPDQRYIVVRGRLWRKSNPKLPDELRQYLVNELMDARRAIASARRVGDDQAEREAHAAVDYIKHRLGERGPVWWGDDAPDYNRHMVKNSPYATWFSALQTD